jgi:long-chain acyl-CoA synthetase
MAQESADDPVQEATVKRFVGFVPFVVSGTLLVLGYPVFAILALVILWIGTLDDDLLIERKDHLVTLLASTQPQIEARAPGDFKSRFPKYPDGGTLPTLLAQAFRDNADMPLLGERTVDKDGNYGAYKWRTYAQTQASAAALGAGLRTLCPWLKSGSKVGIYSKNVPEVTITNIGCWGEGFVIVPLYDSFGPEAVHHIITQSELSVVLVSAENYSNYLEAVSLGGGVPSVKAVIQYKPRGPPSTNQSSPMTAQGEVKMLTFEEVEAAGEDPESRAHVSGTPPTPDSLAFIMYTSGTTGKPIAALAGSILCHLDAHSPPLCALHPCTGMPKGVMLTHGGFIASAAGLLDRVYIGPGDVHISYLPLAHSFEHVVQVLRRRLY